MKEESPFALEFKTLLPDCAPLFPFGGAAEASLAAIAVASLHLRYFADRDRFMTMPTLMMARVVTEKDLILYITRQFHNSPGVIPRGLLRGMRYVRLIYWLKEFASVDEGVDLPPAS